MDKRKLKGYGTRSPNLEDRRNQLKLTPAPTPKPSATAVPPPQPPMPKKQRAPKAPIPMKPTGFKKRI